MDDIARLLEDRLDEIKRAGVLTHICACRRCNELFRDSAIELGLLECGGFLSQAERDDLVAAGMRVVGSDPARARGSVHPGDLAKQRRRRPFASLISRVLIFAAVAVVILWGAWFSIRSLDKAQPVDPEILNAIEVAVGAFSAGSEFVLPGGEDIVVARAPAYRSARGSQFSTSGEPLESALDLLHDRYEAGGESPDVAYWLVAGYLSTHRIGAARVYVADARGLYPEDPRLMVLDAIVAYSDGALDRSETLLRSARKVRPNDPVILLDLAIVLGERQNTGEARELLTTVGDRHPDTPIGARAVALLEKLP